MKLTINEFALSYINSKYNLKESKYKEKLLSEDKEGVVFFSPKKFVKILKFTCTIICYKEDYLVYNYKTGLFDKLSRQELIRLIKYILDTIDISFWSIKDECKILALIDRDYDILKELPHYPKYVFFKNGVYNISTKELEDYNPRLVVTNNISNNYNKNAECPLFLKFINECMCGDEELIKCIQEIMGYTLVDTSKAQKLFLFYGIGSNGKSVLCDLIIHMLGRDNTSSISLNQFKKDFTASCIVGKKANISSENEANFETEKLKAISSGDTITIDVKYKDPYEYRSTCKLIFASNTLPNTLDNTHGFYRRLLIIPFNRVINDSEKDVYLFDKLADEIEGIIVWALEGLHRLIENNYKFTESEATKSLLLSYRENQDPVYLFFKEKLKHEINNKIDKKDLISTYIEWIKENSIDSNGTESTSKFWKELKRVSLLEGIKIEEVKSRNCRFIRHLGWVA